MEQTTHQQYIEAASRRYERHTPGMYPARQIAIVTCMDTRLEPVNGLGFKLGDAHILRNAGGRVTEDVIRSLVLSTALLGVNEVAVLQHTKCGVGSSEQTLRAKVSNELGIDTQDMVFHGFSDVEGSVVDDVEVLRDQELLAGVKNIWGGVVDIDTHRVDIVC